METILRIRDLTVRYDDRDVLRDIDLTLHSGTTLAVIGPNGSGKTTLLHAIVGLVEPATGVIDCDRKRVALVLQSTDVDRSVPITVRDTVRLARYPERGLLRRFRAEDHDAVNAAMQRLQVDDLADRQLHELSGGQRQRVLMAQGLAQDADLLLLDEPVTGLDIGSRQVIVEVMAEERANGHTVVMSTHNLDDARRCDQVLLLDTRPIAVGPADEVLRHEHLQTAFGGRAMRSGDEIFVDDPHHVH